ncbi:Glucosidase 2 subunit beta [Sphaceloma murrayae]|uniref:Glucosidase 2 subunit beta n=1 Tax=Sphaceloma murrayae TaxID=2082308 RepID=A0A2K1R306_9PEZI|nr:Glucosidase 2 subunit beta [Sphaceloma murrayae]
MVEANGVNGANGNGGTNGTNGHTSSLPPVEALPQPKLTQVSEGVSLLLPLSRKGTGPGMIIVTPETAASKLDIKEGVPSPLIKWAEESFTLVEIKSAALASDAGSALRQAQEALRQCPQCEPKDKIALVVYDAKTWTDLSPHLNKTSSFGAAVVYGDVSTASDLAQVAVPVAQHLAGKSDIKLQRTDRFIAYDYPGAAPSFAVPFQQDFNYATEAISHTRNLTFIKKHLGGPYFDLEAIWDEHTYYEFENRSVEHTMATMVQEPYVNHIPTLTGGIGRDNLSEFYRRHFIFNNPEGTELELISRTVGIDRVIDEFLFKLSHTAEVDWLLPGLPPTNRKLEIPFTAVVNIRGDRLYHEHIAWDQATVLAQLGLLPEFLPFPFPLTDGTKPAPGKAFQFQLPVAGIESARKMREKNSVPSNEMFGYKIREVDL